VRRGGGRQWRAVASDAKRRIKPATAWQGRVLAAGSRQAAKHHRSSSRQYRSSRRYSQQFIAKRWLAGGRQVFAGSTGSWQQRRVDMAVLQAHGMVKMFMFEMGVARCFVMRQAAYMLKRN